MIAPTDLLHVLSIQTRSEVSDGHDGVNETWFTTRSRIRGRVRPVNSLGDDRDVIQGRQITPRMSHEIDLRYWRAYVADLAGGRVRVVYHRSASSTDDRTFEVVGPPVDVDEAHEVITIRCREAA